MKVNNRIGTDVWGSKSGNRKAQAYRFADITDQCELLYLLWFKSMFILMILMLNTNFVLGFGTGELVASAHWQMGHKNVKSHNS